MKRFIPLAIALSATCLACTQGAGGPTIKSSNSASESGAQAAPTAPTPVAASITTYQQRVGPLTIPAQTTAEQAYDHPGTLSFHVDDALWITSIEPQLEDAEGNPLPSNLVHLAYLTNQSEENPLCGEKRTGNPFFATTSAMKMITLPEGYGYAVLPDDRLTATVILQNATGQEVSNVYFSFKITGQSMSTSQVTQDLVPLLLDSDPCSHEPLAVEPGGYATMKERFAIPEDGHLIAAYGLLQDYGVRISLAKEQESDAPFWNAAATINREYQVTDLPAFTDTAGIPIQSGDGLVLTVAYHNFSEHWEDATAAAMVYVARSNDTSSATAAKPFRHTKHAAQASNAMAQLLH